MVGPDGGLGHSGLELSRGEICGIMWGRVVPGVLGQCINGSEGNFGAMIVCLQNPYMEAQETVLFMARLGGRG